MVTPSQPGRRIMSPARFCHHCGAAAVVDARFCSSCGTPLAPDAYPAGAVPAETPATQSARDAAASATAFSTVGVAPATKSANPSRWVTLRWTRTAALHWIVAGLYFTAALLWAIGIFPT